MLYKPIIINASVFYVKKKNVHKLLYYYKITEDWGTEYVGS